MIFFLLLFFCFYFFACLRLHHGFKLRGKCAKNSQTEIEIVETAEDEEKIIKKTITAYFCNE